MTSTQYRVIGSRPVRHDGADKVTGKAIYTADTKLPGMLAGLFYEVRMLMQKSSRLTRAKQRLLQASMQL